MTGPSIGRRRRVLAALLLVCGASLAAAGASAQKVHLESRVLDGSGIDPELLAQMAGVAPRPVHAILRFGRPLTRQQHERLTSQGIRLLGYLPDHAYIAAVPGGTDLGGAAFSMLIGADRIRPTDKVSLEFRFGAAPRWAVTKDGALRMVVEFHADVDPAKARAILDRLEIKPAVGAGASFAIQTSRAGVLRLAEEDSVIRIEYGPLPFLPLNDLGRAATNTDAAQVQNVSTAKPGYALSGDEVSIGICDEGVFADHDDLSRVGSDGAPGVSRVVHAQAKTSHGTHVGSIAAGNGVSSPQFEWRGHAPNARIGDYLGLGWEDTRLYSLFYDALVKDKMDLTNHSYVQSLGVYDHRARELDRIVRGDASHDGVEIPPRPQVWAAGNNGLSKTYSAEGNTYSGYYSVFSSSKNTISVGSIDAEPDDLQLSEFSSLGPTLDGRIKPDVVAAGSRESWGGSGIAAASATGADKYVALEGTSMAAPAVSGIIALMIERAREGTAIPTLPSTYKAILIHTARDRKKEEPAEKEWKNPDTGESVLYAGEGPDFATGWGLVDAAHATRVVALSERWLEPNMPWTGDVREWCLSTHNGQAVEATLVWDDPPPAEIADQKPSKLVNDLDLQLVGPNGSVVNTWTVPPPPFTTGYGALDPGDVGNAVRKADHTNNVEKVTATSGGDQVWRVQVIGHNVPKAPQAFSLVASHPLDACK